MLCFQASFSVIQNECSANPTYMLTQIYVRAYYIVTTRSADICTLPPSLSTTCDCAAPDPLPQHTMGGGGGGRVRSRRWIFAFAFAVTISK